MMKLLAQTLVLLSLMLLLGAQRPTSPPEPAQQATPSTAPVQQAAKKPTIPDTFTNLKVLPQNIKKQDLVAIMKAMSVGLKVRCSNCHDATDDLSQADFPSDVKPTKVAAREMLRTLFDVRAKYPPMPAP